MADERDEALRAMALHRGLKLRKSRRRKPGGDFGLYGFEDAGGEAVLGIGEKGLEATGAEIEPEPEPELAVGNLFTKLPAAKRAEVFTALLERPGVRIERIVSQGQATPEDEPMVQERDEWVVLLQGEAGIRIEDSAAVTLRPGDYLTIAGGQRHWVTFTTKDEPTVWLAVHLG